ncbi:MAG TPA: phosphoglycerate kinase, partial [Dehalococcoidia bacterium]
TLLIGGGMASTFLKANGLGVGASLVEDDKLEDARAIIAEAADRHVDLGLPIDAVAGERFAEDAPHQIVAAEAVPDGWLILDVGPKTVQTYEAKLGPARTVVWNGPLGVAEWDAFAQGSKDLARYLAKSDASVIIGGGETVALVSELGLASAYTHVSTGGGASLEFLEGRELPGVAALQDA